MGEHDDRRADLSERARDERKTGEICARAVLHARAAAGIAALGAGVQPREMERHLRRRHPVELGLHRRVSGRHEDADAHAAL